MKTRTIYRAFHGNDEWIKLKDEIIDWVARHGVRKRKISVANGYRNHHGYDPDEETAIRVQALGDVAEAAIAEALGYPIVLSEGVFNVPDLPDDIQVRLIGVEHYGLRVYDSDEDHWRVVGVVIPRGKERERYRLPGWFMAGEAKRHLEWSMAPHNRPPMIAVPQEILRPLSELRQIIRMGEQDGRTPTAT